MTHRKDDRWKWVSLIVGIFAAVSTSMHIIGLPSCNSYVTKAYAADIQDKQERKLGDILSAVEKITEAVQTLTINQAVQEERIKNLER